MKKVLIASTALVAAGLMTTGAASASEKIKLQLGGYSKWWVVGKWNNNNFETAGTGGSGNGTSYNNVDVVGDNEIHFVGSTTLDNGLKVGIQVELEAGGHTDMSSDTIDASFVFVEGGFGKVLLGNHNNGTYLLHVMAPDAAGNWGEGGLLQAKVAIAQPANVMGMPYLNVANVPTYANNGATTAIATDNKAEKITYVAPSFWGLTLGGSYIPNLIEDDRYSKGNDTEAYGVGALYANTFGGVGIKVSGGYVAYDANSADASVNSTNRSFEWSTGGQVSYAGFTVGGSYRKAQTNFEAMGTAPSVPSAGNGSNTSTISAAGRAWDAGIMYANGPYSVSFAYFNSQVQGTRTQTGDDEIEIYQASAKYTLGPGVDLLGSIGHAEFKDETTAASNNNKGWAIMTGLSLAF